jgi:hypothetical protein
MKEVVRFREEPTEDDPYNDVDPALAYEFAKNMVRLGVETEEILDEFIITRSAETTSTSPEDQAR